uniref:dTDP-4-dehydrorhamnose reductase n=1 Tax=Flavobacterium sp. TaxID=239 RepID=UPI00404B18FB
MVVLVTGSQGQLGQAIQFIAKDYYEIEFVFCNSKELDITNFENTQLIFSKYKPHFCINAAAYTAVDKAEIETEKAFLVNVIGVKNVAEACKENDTILLHISTDFVFDGNKNTPYTESDIPNPTGIYGKTKLEGEKVLQKIWYKYFIIRTSWVYSQFGNNFMKTMLRLASERPSLSVVNDQIGTPTNANDLAEALMQMISKYYLNSDLQNSYGIYNFSNSGECSWYYFAKKIFASNNIDVNLEAIPTSSFPTLAKRPNYSVLNTDRIKKVFGIESNKWDDSLKSLTQGEN